MDLFSCSKCRDDLPISFSLLTRRVLNVIGTEDSSSTSRAKAYIYAFLAFGASILRVIFAFVIQKG